MSRSVWKSPFSDVKLKIHKGGHAPNTRVWSRASVILPEYLGKKFLVHNGKTWVKLEILERIIGHRFGEFAATRRNSKHKAHKFKSNSKTRNLPA